MLAPVSWLKEYVSFKADVEKLAEKLLLSGTKVEQIKKVGEENVLELEITPNRPDTLSLLGLAREISSLFNSELEIPETELLLPNSNLTNRVLFKVADKKLLENYSLVRLNNIEIEESPEWIKKYLELSGVRAINNIVDITNFVMLETGQPMHAFDATKIKGELTVRGAKKGEKVVTLDSVERVLPENAIIIEDEEKLVDLAGLMGGENSEIDEGTKEIILLSPIYSPTIIRKTSLATKLRTEASTRFEKKLDLNGHLFALNRAVKLLSENALARLSSKITTTPAVEEETLEVELDSIAEILGIAIPKEEVFDLLTSVGFKIKSSQLSKGSLEITIPTFRTDIAIEEDIVEEIARLYGYNKLPKTIPAGKFSLKEDPLEKNLEQIREFLLLNGFNESTGYSLISEKEVTEFGFKKEEVLKVLNPASSDFEYLRPTLLINLIKAVSANPERTDRAFFEISKVYLKETDPGTKLPKQPVKIGIISTKSLSEVKGVLDELFRKANREVSEKIAQDPLFESSLDFIVGSKVIGKFGTVNSKLASKFGLTGEVFAAEFLAEVINFEDVPNYQMLAKYPSVIEDFSFYLGKKYLIGELVGKLKKVDNLINSVDLVDIFESAGKRSVTLRIAYLDQEKTLTSEEASKVRSKIVNFLKKDFDAPLRKN